MSAAILRTEKRRAVATGFTLLELMAIVAISGVLTALLLPALSSAKEKSRRSVCVSNQRQDLVALNDYVDEPDNEGYLPSAADNQGAYHAIVLSDDAFWWISQELEGTNCLYCPNLVYATGQMGGYNPLFGYTIGYSYLATNALYTNPKGPFEEVPAQKADATINAILADANYWSSTSAQQLTIAPHGPGGATVAAAVSGSKSGAVATNSAAAGAMGGNEGFMDGHVVWRSIQAMQAYPASSDGSAQVNW